LVFGCRCSHVGCFIGLHMLFTWWANGRILVKLQDMVISIDNQKMRATTESWQA